MQPRKTLAPFIPSQKINTTLASFNKCKTKTLIFSNVTLKIPYPTSSWMVVFIELLQVIKEMLVPTEKLQNLQSITVGYRVAQTQTSQVAHADPCPQPKVATRKKRWNQNAQWEEGSSIIPYCKKGLVIEHNNKFRITLENQWSLCLDRSLCFGGKWGPAQYLVGGHNVMFDQCVNQ